MEDWALAAALQVAQLSPVSTISGRSWSGRALDPRTDRAGPASRGSHEPNILSPAHSCRPWTLQAADARTSRRAAIPRSHPSIRFEFSMLRDARSRPTPLRGDVFHCDEPGRLIVAPTMPPRAPSTAPGRIIMIGSSNTSPSPPLARIAAIVPAPCQIANKMAAPTTLTMAAMAVVATPVSVPARSEPERLDARSPVASRSPTPKRVEAVDRAWKSSGGTSQSSAVLVRNAAANSIAEIRAPRMTNPSTCVTYHASAASCPRTG